MPLRHVARILFCSALASVAGTYVGGLLFGWLGVLTETREWSEALAAMVFIPFAAFVGTVYILPQSFPTACALAFFWGGCLWQLGRERAWARNRAPWLAVGALCGLVEAVRLVAGDPSLLRESWLVLGLPAAAAGGAAALLFRALMPLVPPYCDPGLDGGWDL
ncbi:MAG: hypothetical protein QOE79_1563 [Sphingomonadales bacterium]|jgi:hypothetical protein|nr:hypothetical protein [Sphingomonadales bacterium]